MIEHLQQDGRRPFTQIAADELDLTPEQVRQNSLKSHGPVTLDDAVVDDYGDVPVSSLARERERNPYFQHHDLASFVGYRMRPR